MKNNYSLTISIFLFFISVCNICMETEAKPLCPVIKERINFTVKVIPKNISYNLDLRQKGLNQLAGKNLKQKSNQRVLGLTSTKQSVSARMRGHTTQISSSLYCTGITTVDVEIKVMQLNVYVLGKYPRGSCQYSAIIDHEHEHVATYQAGISKLERVFNNRLWNIIRNLPPGIASTSKRSANAAFKHMEEKITALRTPIEQAMKYRDRQIDTPLSYKLLTQQCASW
jgi:hypothetical protein